MRSLPEPIQAAFTTGANVRCVEEVVSLTEQPKLAKLQQVDEKAVYNVIGLLLSQMVVDMHMDNGLTDNNVRSIATRLTIDEEVRWWLTLPDIALLCRKIVEGDFGKFYGHFGVAEFNNCLNQYCQERTEVHRMQHEKKVADTTQLSVQQLGYTLDADGRLVVSESAKESRLAQPLYLYDNKGKRVGVNPKGYFGKQSNMTSRMQLVKALMRENKELDLDQAIDMVEGKQAN